MSNTLGIDLGTNSIGLAIRNENVFDWFGVYTFKKGVGIDKTGEFSYAATRTKHRSARRLYNARRYRKWETLRVLIENDFCPLGIKELNRWKNYEKGTGRVFPIENNTFNQWIKLDFNSDGKPDYISPYQLRRELIKSVFNVNEKSDKYKIGRALYHIAQRRGFKSSRKGGDKEKSSMYKGSNETNTIGVDKYKDLIDEKGSLGAALAHLEDEKIRIRNRYTLRKDYFTEVEKICDFQKLGKDFKNKILKAIFFQRPLRSQKGLVGKCTLEKNKYRCPINYYKFEDFRAWSFLNTIKFKENIDDDFQDLPLDLKQKILNELFYRKSKSNFKFKEIRTFIQKHGRPNWVLNYKPKLDDNNVSACPISARFQSVFGEGWRELIIKTGKTRQNKKGETINIEYNIDDIWHILFTYEDEEIFEELLKETLRLEDDQIKELKTLWNNFPIGYANLSIKAINNILPFLKKGLIYTEAVLLAKIPELIGKDIFNNNRDLIYGAIKEEIKNNREVKSKLIIVNTLISEYFSEFPGRRAKGVDDKIKEVAIKEVKKAVIRNFGKNKWKETDSDKQKEYLDFVTDKYLKFLDGKQEYQEKASYSETNNPDIDYYKMPHLLDQIKEFLIGNFDWVTEKELSKMYHPSQIDIYPKEDNQTYLKSPKTAAFKNPMAYKTLYKLKDTINYLIKIGKIDSETKIVVEIARDLNDANKRNAIETYQRRRELENKEYAKAIAEFKGNDNIADVEIKKYRLWKEQNEQCIYTGRTINISDLFNNNIIDFEHTIPRSKSFDNSMENLTVCYADYNRSIKKTKLPTELNYKCEYEGYSDYEPRLKKWREKIENLEKKIENQKFRSKVAIDKDSKDRAIREKHLLFFEFDYWKNKLDRFTRKDIPKGFVNSQLRDTQLITKYAYHYLRTVFNKVEVQKGSVTAEFRKIYQIEEKGIAKSRAKHHHHAIDAAVLTLIPDSAKREEILKKNFEYFEANYKH